MCVCGAAHLVRWGYTGARRVMCAVLPPAVTGEGSGHDRIRERNRNSGCAR